MRALFTQLSFFIGLLTAINLNAAQPSLPVAIILGLSAGCTIYIVLLLGDYTVHRWLEEKAPELTSVQFIEEPFDELEQHDIDQPDDKNPPYSEQGIIAA